MNDFALFGNDLLGDPVRKAQAPLADRFVVPPFSVGKQFEAGRKLGKTHQNVLIFRR